MTVSKIGNITLTYPMWWTNYNDSDSIISESEIAIDGSVVVWELPPQTTAVKINLSSLDNGWQSKAVIDDLKILINSSVGGSTTITTTNNDIINVRFRNEDKAMTAKRVVDIKLFNYFKCDINLARV